MFTDPIFAVPPLRLMAMRNGVRDITKAAAVVGPDLTNVSSLIPSNVTCVCPAAR